MVTAILLSLVPCTDRLLCWAPAVPNTFLGSQEAGVSSGCHASHMDTGKYLRRPRPAVTEPLKNARGQLVPGRRQHRGQGEETVTAQGSSEAPHITVSLLSQLSTFLMGPSCSGLGSPLSRHPFCSIFSPQLVALGSSSAIVTPPPHWGSPLSSPHSSGPFSVPQRFQ